MTKYFHFAWLLLSRKLRITALHDFLDFPKPVYLSKLISELSIKETSTSQIEEASSFPVSPCNSHLSILAVVRVSEPPQK